MQQTQPTLLILTDDPNQRLALSEFLSYDYQILAASTGEEGLTLLLQAAAPVAGIITDLKTLRHTGLDVLIKTRQESPEVQLLVITPANLTAPGDLLTGRTVITYLPEPFTYDQLKVRLEEAQHIRQHDRQPLELSDLVQLYCLSQAKVAVTIVRQTETGAAERGKIYFEAGRLTNAACAEWRGEEALFYLYGWETGRFFTRYNIVAKQKAIQTDWQTLLHNARTWFLQYALTQQHLERATAEEDARTPSIPPFEEPGAPQADAFTPAQRQAIEHILQELQAHSEDLKHALLTDRDDQLLTAISPEAVTELSRLSASLTKIRQFSTQASQHLALGPIDEILVLGAELLLVSYPVAPIGNLSVITHKAQQGMIRWNCRDAIHKIQEQFQPDAVN